MGCTNSKPPSSSSPPTPSRRSTRGAYAPRTSDESSLQATRLIHTPDDMPRLNSKPQTYLHSPSHNHNPTNIPDNTLSTPSTMNHLLPTTPTTPARNPSTETNLDSTNKPGQDIIGQDDSPLIDTRRPIPRAVPPPGVMTGKRRAGQSLENPNSNPNLNLNLNLALDPNAGRKDAEACVVAGEQREGQEGKGEGEDGEEESESIGISINKGNTRNCTC